MSLFPPTVEAVLAGIPRGRYSNVYVVDPVNGSDSNPGTKWTAPLLTVTAAYAKCTADQHDVVVMVSGDTADNPAASITWAKDYTHLIGLSSNLPGLGQRCRIVGTAANALTPVITFSGNGCIVRNIQFYNGKETDTDSGCVIVSGNRNEFKNVFVAGMAHATPAARAGSYSLKVTGAENLFKDCTIGLDTITRGAGEPPELWLATGASKDTFQHCLILTRSETATASPVKIDAEPLGLVIFEDCLFANISTNWATSLDDAFSITSVQTHYVVMRGLNQLVGITGWADTVTHMYSAAPQSNAGFGVAVTPTT